VTRGDRYAVGINGDALEGRHHGATHQISQNLADQLTIARRVIEPIRDRATHLYMIRGTEAHVGASGESEEALAVMVAADHDPESGQHSRYEAFVRVGDCSVHCAHHIGATGSMAYETSAVTKEMNEFLADSARWGESPPDVIVRSHRHRQSRVYLDGHRGQIIGLVTGGWQGKTPFAFRVPGGRITRPHIGGAIIRQGDEEHYVRTFLRTIPRPQPIIMEG